MTQTPIASNSDLTELLHLQEQFLSLVHTHLYHQDQVDRLLKFEIHHISPANQQLNQMIQILNRDLVSRKIPYELSLRDYFQRLLQADFLPLLRINRFELTKLSLFGFDIYIEPLQAVLQILSRLEVVKKRIIQSKFEVIQGETAEEALQKGWDRYMYYCDQWRVSFNLYILEQYLRFGGKSFLKKDRQILFTGINSFYNQLVPQSTKKNNYKLLKQLAQLNNSLYNFHPSFNYFYFYSMLLPLQDNFEPIFFYANQILQKCLRTNILTPLLFGILRHRQSFLRFIRQVDSPIWLPYINVIISGITINLKFRILQYEQIIQLFEQACNKAGLLGKIRIDQITGTLQEGWKDAKQFFISAVKIGFNSGEVQTWKVIQFEKIGPRVLKSLLDGMLLNIQDNPNWQTYLDNGEQKLSQQLKLLSDNKLEWNSIKSWICQLQKQIESEKQYLNLIRIANIIRILRIEDEYSINFIISSILSISQYPNNMISRRIQECVDRINHFLCSHEEANWSFIKEKVIEMHRKYHPIYNSELIIKFYFKHYEPKKALGTLISILNISDKDNCEILATEIARRFNEDTTKLVRMKTFEKQLLVRSSLVNASYEGHCILSVLSQNLIEKHQSIEDLIYKIVEKNPTITFSLLNFPINEDGRLLSFGTYLIEHPNFHSLLQSILIISKGVVLSEQKIDLIQTLSIPSICEQLYKKINEQNQIQLLIYYSQLLFWIFTSITRCGAWRDLLAIYLFLLEKNVQVKHLERLINDICILLVREFSDKINVWMASAILKKIQGRFDIQKNIRKQALKTSGSSIYFINQLQQQKEQTKNQAEDTKQVEFRKDIQENNSNQQLVGIFWKTYSQVSQMSLKQLNQIREKQSTVFQEEIKALFIPQLSQNMIQHVSTLSQDQQQKHTKIVVFVSINAENYLRLANKAITSKNYKYLAANRYIPGLNPKMSAILTLQAQLNSNILQQMCKDLSIREKEKIADQLFFQTSVLGHYIEFFQGIQFMAINNNFNWRILIDFLCKQFTKINLNSAVLEYNQYINITSQLNKQYEEMVYKNTNNFQKYIKLLQMKFKMIEGSFSHEQVQLKFTNQLTFLNLILKSLQMSKVAGKLGILHRNMMSKGLTYCSRWMECMQKLNELINTYLKTETAGNALRGSRIIEQEKQGDCRTQIDTILKDYKFNVENNVNQQSEDTDKCRQMI